MGVSTLKLAVMPATVSNKNETGPSLGNGRFWFNGKKVPLERISDKQMTKATDRQSVGGKTRTGEVQQVATKKTNRKTGVERNRKERLNGPHKERRVRGGGDGTRQREKDIKVSRR